MLWIPLLLISFLWCVNQIFTIFLKYKNFKPNFTVHFDSKLITWLNPTFCLVTGHWWFSIPWRIVNTTKLILSPEILWDFQYEKVTSATTVKKALSKPSPPKRQMLKYHHFTKLLKVYSDSQQSIEYSYMSLEFYIQVINENKCKPTSFILLSYWRHLYP